MVSKHWQRLQPTYKPYLSGIYCHKTGTRPPSCNTPREPTIYSIIKGFLEVKQVGKHCCTAFVTNISKWMYIVLDKKTKTSFYMTSRFEVEYHILTRRYIPQTHPIIRLVKCANKNFVLGMTTL